MRKRYARSGVPIPLGAVPEGWTRSGWIEHCRHMAAICESCRPDLAEQWRTRARLIEADGGEPQPDNGS